MIETGQISIKGTPDFESLLSGKILNTENCVLEKAARLRSR